MAARLAGKYGFPPEEFVEGLFGQLFVSNGAVASGTFVVQDSGCGVHGIDIATLFDPFVTADHAGIGLGLAIAKRAILAHGGTIEARNREPGGLEVRIMLPAVAA